MLEANLGWVVQKLVNFNSGLSKNPRCNFFFKIRITILLEYSVWIFKGKNLLMLKLQLKSFSVRLETTPRVKRLTLD